MRRSLPGTVPDYKFSLDVVEVMHDGSRMMSKEVSTVIDSCLYTLYVYFCNISVFALFHMKISVKLKCARFKLSV